MAVLGVDVSKADFRCFLIDGEACAAEKFENKPAGYRDMLKWLQTQRSAEIGARGAGQRAGPGVVAA